jgi:hypothetical protein
VECSEKREGWEHHVVDKNGEVVYDQTVFGD